MRRRTRRSRRSSIEPKVEEVIVEEQPQVESEEEIEERTARVFGEASDETPRRRRRRSSPVPEAEEEPEVEQTPEPEPEPLPPEPVQRRRRVRKPVAEPEPEPVEEVKEPDPIEEDIPEPEPKAKPKRGRPSKQKPRKIMGPEVRERQKRAVVFEESPQNVTVREAEPEEVVSPFSEPLTVPADSEEPLMEIDLDAVPVRRVRVEPQLARYKPLQDSTEEESSSETPQSEPESEELIEDSHLPVLLTSEELLDTLCSMLDRGYSILLNKVGNRYVLKEGDQKIPRSRFPMTKKQADALACTDEYKVFTKKWDALSIEERVAYAQQIGATWDGNMDQIPSAGRLKRSVMRAAGVKKWKPEYRKPEARTRLWKEGIYADPL